MSVTVWNQAIVPEAILESGGRLRPVHKLKDAQHP